MLSKSDKQWIDDFFTTKIVPLVHDAVKMSQVRKMRLIDGKSDPGSQTAIEKEVNIIDIVAGYLPDVARSVTGLQSDFSKFNAATIKSLKGILDTQKKNVALLENYSNNLELPEPGNVQITIAGDENGD